MSNNRITGSSPAAPTATTSAASQVGASASLPTQGALGLGIDVGVLTLPETESMPAGSSSTVPANDADRFDRRARPGAGSTAREFEQAEPRSRNPFGELKGDDGSVQERRLSETKVGMEQELDPSLEVARKLVVVERSLGDQHRALCNKLRLGLTLVTADGQATRAQGSAVPQQVIETLAATIMARGRAFSEEDHRTALTAYARYQGAIGQNIQAYVQRVLRECYLIQNQQLLDFAAKVQHFNDLKKKTREVLEQARATRTAWAGAARGNESFIASEPFAWLEVDDDCQTYTPAMTAEDVEHWRAEAQAAADGAKESGTTTSAVVAECQALYGESQLTADERDTLAALAKNKDTSIWDKLHLDPDAETDDYIRQRMDELLPLIPKMNHDDLKQYLLPIIAILSGGNADEAELLQIFGALSPVQLIFLQSGGLDVDDLDSLWQRMREGASHGAAAGTAVGAVAGPLAVAGAALVGGLAGVVTSFFDGDVFNDSEQAELDQLGRRAGRLVAEAMGVELSGDLDAAKAAELLAALKAHADPAGGSAISPLAGAPIIGSPKQIRTVQAMEDYIKLLEDRLSSLGDDAQLANVDLQNELQKQQQTLQMLTNISKMLHDTALAIVRKISG
jgi:hypothetical protein